MRPIPPAWTLFLACSHASASAFSCSRCPPSPERPRSSIAASPRPQLAGQQQQRRARHLLGARHAPARALLGRRQLGREVQPRLLRRLEEQGRRLQALQQQLQAVQRADAAVHDRRLRRARRLALGAPAVAAPVAQLRRRARRATSCTSRTGAATSPSSRSRPTTATTASISTCGASSRSTASRSSARTGRSRACRPTSRAATSTSTTSRARLAPGQQLPDPSAHRGLLLHVREPPGVRRRPGTARARATPIAPRPSARASRRSCRRTSRRPARTRPRATTPRTPSRSESARRRLALPHRLRRYNRASPIQAPQSVAAERRPRTDAEHARARLERLVPARRALGSPTPIAVPGPASNVSSPTVKRARPEITTKSSCCAVSASSWVSSTGSCGTASRRLTP